MLFYMENTKTYVAPTVSLTTTNRLLAKDNDNDGLKEVVGSETIEHDLNAKDRGSRDIADRVKKELERRDKGAADVESYHSVSGTPRR